MGFYVILVCVSVAALMWTGVGILISYKKASGGYFDSFNVMIISITTTAMIVFIGFIAWVESGKAIADIDLEDYMRVNEWTEYHESLRNGMKGYLKDDKITRDEFREIKKSIEVAEKERLRNQMRY